VVGSDDSGRFRANDRTIGGSAENTAESDNANHVGLETHNVVEPALARALALAAEAGRWGLVAQIARELEERRRLRAHPISSAAEHPTERKGAQRRR
jgi:hypothetical protein